MRGGRFDHPLEINKEAPWDPLLKVILKPIKFMITCKKSGKYLKKFTEILRFENFEITRFCYTLAYENCRKSLNFLDTMVLFWMLSSFCWLEKGCLATLALWVILKPIKVMISCQKLYPYLKNSMRYWDLKILIWRDFVIPWPTEIAIARSVLEIQGSSSGFCLLFICSTNAI